MPSYPIDPHVGPRAKQKLPGSGITAQLWTLPVEHLPANTLPFLTAKNPAQPQERDSGMEFKPLDIVVSAPAGGRITVQAGSAFSNVFILSKSLGYDVQHQVLGLTDLKVTDGQVIKAGAALGRPYQKTVRWQVRILLNDTNGEVLSRWNAVLARSPGHPRIQNAIAQWLMTPEDPDWMSLLETLERGGQPTAWNQAAIQIGEGGQQAATAVKDTIRDNVRNTVNVVQDIGQEAQSVLEPLLPDASSSATGWIVGGVSLALLGGFVAWKVLR